MSDINFSSDKADRVLLRSSIAIAQVFSQLLSR
jgi:hypothetical protein